MSLLKVFNFLTNKRFWKFIAKRMIVIVVCFIFILLSVIFKKLDDVFISITSNIIIFVLAFDIFTLLYYYERRKEDKELVMIDIDIDKELLQWSGRLGLDNKFIYSLFSKEGSKKSLSNLIQLKRNIKHASRFNKNNLYLLKEYLELKSKDNLSNNTRSILITAVTGGVITIITQLNSKYNILLHLHNTIINSTNQVETTSILTNYITYCTYGLIAVMAFLFFREAITKSRNRIKLILIAVDSCINEFEKK